VAASFLFLTYQLFINLR